MGQVRNTVRIRKRDRILGRGVVRFLICESRIFTAKGGSVYFLKYLLKLQGLNNYNFFFFNLSTKMLIFTTTLSSILSLLCTRTCPTMVKIFALRKDEQDLVIQVLLLYGFNPHLNSCDQLFRELPMLSTRHLYRKVVISFKDNQNMAKNKRYHCGFH